MKRLLQTSGPEIGLYNHGTKHQPYTKAAIQTQFLYVCWRGTRVPIAGVFMCYSFCSPTVRNYLALLRDSRAHRQDLAIRYLH